MNIKGAIAFLVGWKAYAAAAVAGVLVLGIYTAAVHHDGYVKGKAKTETKIITHIEKAQAQETVRRETVLQKVQVRSAADIKEIDRLHTQRAALLEEINRASIAHNGDTCLSRDSILRLAAIR